MNSLYGEKFNKAIERCLGHEGGYSNDPDDPGGETQWGISKRSYPSLNIKDLTREQAVALYHRDFWNKIGGESFPTSIGFQLLDFAINSGPSTALRALQRAVGVADDGHIGPFTLAAIKRMELHDLAMLFVAERMMFMTSLKNWPNAGRGWTRRMAGNLRYAAEDINYA